MPIRFNCPHCGNVSLVADSFAGQSGPCKSCGRNVTVPAASQQSAVAPASPEPEASAFPRLFPWIIALSIVGMCCCGGVPALVLWGRQQARESARHGDCRGNILLIAQAMLQYEGSRGTLPPAYVADKDGKPMHSWRVLILPYLDEQELYKQYDMNEPWNGPNNSRLAAKMPKVYSCLEDETSSITQYAVMTGPGLVFDGANTMSIADISKGDGASRTLTIVECHDAKINWMEPRDLDAATMAPTSQHAGGVNVAFADGHLQFLRNNISPEVFGALLTPRGGEPFDEKQLAD